VADGGLRFGVGPHGGGATSGVDLLTAGAGLDHATLRGLGELTQVAPLFALEDSVAQLIQLLAHADESGSVSSLF
jgi:hypothetical protein